ncbi:hypothetical protein LY78DRAFT_131868 [Colletotrichum sublineola]|nr:hypothetical protein LY78DRAFT_131868 [Colletotrichum sublineola]
MNACHPLIALSGAVPPLLFHRRQHSSMSSPERLLRSTKPNIWNQIRRNDAALQQCRLSATSLTQCRRSDAYYMRTVVPHLSSDPVTTSAKTEHKTDSCSFFRMILDSQRASAKEGVCFEAFACGSDHNTIYGGSELNQMENRRSSCLDPTQKRSKFLPVVHLVDSPDRHSRKPQADNAACTNFGRSILRPKGLRAYKPPTPSLSPCG